MAPKPNLFYFCPVLSGILPFHRSFMLNNGTRVLFLTTIVAILFTGFAGSGCEKPEIEAYSGMGKKPVYLPVSELSDINNISPQPTGQTGTIFLQDTLFFMLEQKKGIHVFNVKDSLHVFVLTFFQIPAVTDFTIAGNRLYADSWKDLVTIDISDIYHIREIDRQLNVFSPLLYPPLYSGIFECVDESKGAVVGWEDAMLDNVLCRMVN